MREYKKHIEIDIPNLNHKLSLTIYQEYDNSLFLVNEDEAITNGEAVVQLLEGRSYEYKLSNENYSLYTTINGVVSVSKRDNSSGRITPNIYVGTLSLFVRHSNKQFQETKISVEVLATKMNSELDKSYRENYRFMLYSITEKCTELLMQIDSPITQNFETSFDTDSQTLYQRFCFVKSLINSIEFEEAVQKVVSNPTTKWEEEQEEKDIRGIRRFTQKSIKQLVAKGNRIEISEAHFLYKLYKLTSIPLKIASARKKESTDTPENRFIKHALEEFLFFCENCEIKFEKYSTAKLESNNLSNKISNLLNQSFFKEISRPTSLKLNSPVLQRKSGYREVLNAWLKFDLAAKLVWNGGDAVYGAGKKDIAVLYEYWLFFTLYDLIKRKFKINQHQYEEKPYEHLIVPTNDGLNVMVKSGKHTALEGVYDSENRKLQIKFSYNRTFTGGTEYINNDDKKFAGSWTKTLRPDYTLSIWPCGLNENKNDKGESDAEEKELIVHIHFDSKYKVDQYVIKPDINPNLSEEEIKEAVEKELNEEKEEERKGKYKNADLLKMHAYKDAIRRTGGAYILYPGTDNQKPLKGFHEIIPGLGAFAIRPSAENTGITELSKFVESVINHLLDRASQREFTAVKSYEIHKKKKKEYLDDDVTPNILSEPMPEYIDDRKLIPTEVFVLVGYYKDESHLSWIKEKNLYNVRYGDKYALSPDEIGTNYLLLYSKDQTESNKFYKINKNGPKLYTKSELKKDLKYKTTPSQDLYLIYQLEKEIEKEFKDLNIDLSKLDGLGENKRPVAISIEKLLRSKIK